MKVLAENRIMVIFCIIFIGFFYIVGVNNQTMANNLDDNLDITYNA